MERQARLFFDQSFGQVGANIALSPRRQVEIVGTGLASGGESISLSRLGSLEVGFEVHASIYQFDLIKSIILIVYHFDLFYYPWNMKTTAEIRLSNARDLASLFETKADFARALEMSDAYMWQILGDTPKRNIGNSIARRMELACGKPEGWLDVPHSPESVSDSPSHSPKGEFSSDALKVARAFDTLSTKAQKDAVMAQLRAFGAL